MIPKKIHYCWYGGKSLPELAEKCIDSWKKYCSDYKIIRWDETNTDLNENDYIKEAYESKKWAFVTDYARLKILYEQGGIYMDTDVEVCGSLDDFLNESAFSGFEDSTHIQTGIMACEKGHPFFEKLMRYYDGRHFVQPGGVFDQTTNVQIITEIASEYGFVPNDTKQSVAGMTLYPHDFFCPKDNYSGKVNITDNTVCIHHFNGSWIDDELIKWMRLKAKYGKVGEWIYTLNKYFFHPKRILTRVREKTDKNI